MGAAGGRHRLRLSVHELPKLAIPASQARNSATVILTGILAISPNIARRDFPREGNYAIGPRPRLCNNSSVTCPFGADFGLSRDVDSWRLRILPRYATFENGRHMQPDDIWVSIVVDAVDDHLYKADLLIRTMDIALLCRSATLTAYLFTFQSAQGPLSRSHLGLQMNTLKSASCRLPHDPILRACLEAACSTSPSKK
jgi:hypothetical protein